MDKENQGGGERDGPSKACSRNEWHCPKSNVLLSLVFSSSLSLCYLSLYFPVACLYYWAISLSYSAKGFLDSFFLSLVLLNWGYFVFLASEGEKLENHINIFAFDFVGCGTKEESHYF